MKKSLAAIALAGSIALVGAVPAIATTYPAPGSDEQGQVDDGNIQEGEQFNFSGGGFDPNEPINVEVEQTGGPQAIGGSFSGVASLAVAAKISLPLAPQTFATRANGSGTFSLPLTINEAGTYRLTATGVNSGHTVTATVTVKAATGTAAGSGTGAGLANTGADSSLVLWSLVGGGALAAGVASVVVVRRRAKADAATA
ncbi:LPXTG cell wall anchor domain-containing protein [Micrococcaceae bacterium Sec5.7]